LSNGAPVQTKSTIIDAKEQPFQNLAETRRKGEIYSPSQMERSLPLTSVGGGGDIDIHYELMNIYEIAYS
jgi:hypothetical protein